VGGCHNLTALPPAKSTSTHSSGNGLVCMYMKMRKSLAAMGFELQTSSL